MFTPIVEPALKKRRTTEVVPLDFREATLVLNKANFRSFPSNDRPDFGELRLDPEFAYFDRTDFISALESFDEDVLLFLRPRRFGKSLTLSMLAHFHGVQYKELYDELFQVESNYISSFLIPHPC